MQEDTYNRRKSQGQCVQCGGIPKAGRQRCDSCLKLASEKRGSLARERFENQQCSECAVQLESKKWRCSECTEKERQRVKRARKKYRALGLCNYCPNPVDAGSIVCVEHRNKRKVNDDKRRANRTASQLCTSCGSELPKGASRLTCSACSERNRLGSEQKRRTIFSWYGSGCACCGESNYYFLTLDHVNNDGAQERKQLGGQQQVLSRLWKEQCTLPEYQLLCYNCNCAKGMRGECPHVNEPRNL